MSYPFNSGPQAPENNPPINPQYYYPNLSFLASITPVSDFQTTVATTEDNQFVVGQLVRFVIPNRDGMYQLNEQTAYITSIIDAQTFNVAISTLGFGVFNPSRNPLQRAIVLPVGDTNSGQINASGRLNYGLDIPGSFINISPF